MKRVICLILLLLSYVGYASSTPVIVMLSDYGLLDESVAVCKGTILGLEPEVRIIDLTHQVPAFSVKDAGRFLAATTPFYPEGTIFMALVERSGGKRSKKLLALTKRNQYILAPDNGLITEVGEREGFTEVREIVESPWVKKEDLESIFPGRDIFSKVAAHLAKGDAIKTAGPLYPAWVHMETKKSQAGKQGVRGEILAVDGVFGNLITNLSVTSLLNAGYTLGETVVIQIGDKNFSMKFVKTFEDVPVGNTLIYIDTTDHASIAINQGNFATKNKIKIGTKVLLPNKNTGKE